MQNGDLIDTASVEQYCLYLMAIIILAFTIQGARDISRVTKTNGTKKQPVDDSLTPKRPEAASYNKYNNMNQISYTNYKIVMFLVAVL